MPQENARIYRAVNLELASGKDLASVDEHWMMFAKFTLNVLQRFLVSRMNRLVSQEGDKGYFLVLRSHLQSDTYPWIFFFQAEDGIRDVAVTGVQTCALPI